MAVGQTPVETVEAIYAAFAAADLDAVMAHCAPDITIVQDPDLPWGGRYTGRDGVAEFAVKLIGAIDSKVTTEALFRAGDQVVQHGRTRGTVRATGVAFDVAECHLWTVTDGVATLAQYFIDTDAMLAALDG